MNRSTTILILSIVALVLITATSVLYVQKSGNQSNTSTQSNNSTSLPADPSAGTIQPGILASKYPDDAQFIQELQNQLGAFGVDEILPDPQNPKRIYYTYTTNGEATQIKYYDPTSDKTFNALHWPIVQNGSISLTTGLTNIPAGQTAHPVDVIEDKFIYAISNFADRPNLNDPCESLLLYYLHTPMFSIDNSGKIVSFTPDRPLIASEQQKQSQCSTNP